MPLRPLAALALAQLLACAEMRLPPTFPSAAAGQPVIQEQALVGLSPAGDAAAVQLIDADGEEPELLLLALDHGGGPSRIVERAPAERARAVAARLRAEGISPQPRLASEVAAAWPEAVRLAAARGYPPRLPEVPEESGGAWLAGGALAAGSRPLVVRAELEGDDPRAVVLLLGERGGGLEVELARLPVVGTPIASELWIQADTAWLLAGSVSGGDGGPLRRTVGLRRGSLQRGKAELHLTRARGKRAAGESYGARRELAEALAADPDFFDALYAGACFAAVAGRTEEALALLRRASRNDPRRVQVLGRDDPDLNSLREDPEVRALLGLKRLPP